MTEAQKKFLDDLRDSAKINMFGAGPHLMKKFGLTRTEARDVLFAWMEVQP